MHCAECAALQTRLQAFDDVTMPESAAEWSQQQIRLDNWLDGFLRSERASRAKRKGKSLRGVPTWENASEYLLSGNLQWALGATVVLLLVIGSVLLVRFRHPQLPQHQAALRGAMPQPQPGSPPATSPVVGPSPASKTLQQPARPAVNRQLAINAKTSSVEKTQKVGSQRKPAAPGEVEAHNAPTLTAEAHVPPPSTAGSSSLAGSSERASNRQQAPGPTASLQKPALAPTAIRNRPDGVTRPTTNAGAHPATNAGMHPAAAGAGAHSTTLARTTSNVSLKGGGTAQVSRRPNGRVAEVHANGMTIHQSLHGGGPNRCSAA